MSSQFRTYATEELDAFREGLRQDCIFGSGRFRSAEYWSDVADLAQGGTDWCDREYGEHDAKRAVQVEVYREMAQRSSGSEEPRTDSAPAKPSGPGYGTGRADRKGGASEKQKAFLESLLEGRSDEIAQAARARIDSVSGYINSETASKLIDSLMAAAPGIVAWKERMTTGQRDFLLSMWAERGVPANTAKVVLTKVWLRSTKEQASAMIDRAKDAAKASKDKARSASAQEGFYELGDRVVKVQKGTTTGNLYAKLLRVDPDLEKGFEWVYTPGLVAETIGAKPLSRERAAELGQDLRLYGYCFKCGLKLTDEESIERGIGRICWDKMA